jgi:hypothetical protein
MTTSEEYEQKGRAAEEKCAVENENIKLVFCPPEPTRRFLVRRGRSCHAQIAHHAQEREEDLKVSKV